MSDALAKSAVPPTPATAESVGQRVAGNRRVYCRRDLGAHFGGGEAGRKRWLRWVAKLPDDPNQKRMEDGQWVVTEAAVREHLASIAPAILAEVRNGTRKTGRMELVLRELRRLDDQFQLQHWWLGVTTPRYAKELARVHGSALNDYAREQGVDATVRIYAGKLQTIRKRHAAGEALYQGGRSGRKPDAEQPDQRVVAAYEAVALHANFDSLAEAWRHARDTADELGLPMANYDWWRRWLNRTHPLVAVRYCKSKRKFEAENLPKIHRNYDAVPPLDWVSLDGHVMNCFARVPTANQSWKRARPVLSGVLDVRSRMFLGWDIRECETSDGILASIKQCISEHGCPDHYYADNGEAFKASLGHPRRLNRKVFDDPRIGAICAQTGAQRHTSIPYQAWAKIIESLWRAPIDGFERYCWSWIGNSPANRPDDRHKEIVANIEQLPTLDEFRRQFADYLKVYHAQPQSGSGMFGLSPAECFTQHCTELRRLEDDTLDFLCCRLVGPRKVQPDGVLWNDVRYGHFDVDVWKLQGRDVYLRIDPDQADFVWICDEKGAPLCMASARQITGATQEEVREAHRIRGRMRKIAKEYAPARDFLLETSTAQIMQRKAVHATRRAAERAKQLPTPPTPAVKIVRPDLVEPVRAAKRKRAANAIRAAVNAPSNPTGFQRLAARESASEISNLESEIPATPTETEVRRNLAKRFAQLNYEEETA